MMLDVLEHIPTIEEIKRLISLANVSKGILVRIPVCVKEGENYYFKESRNDRTHIHCHTKEWWINLFKESNFILAKKVVESEIYDSEGVLAAIFKKRVNYPE